MQLREEYSYGANSAPLLYTFPLWRHQKQSDMGLIQGIRGKCPTVTRQLVGNRRIHASCLVTYCHRQLLFPFLNKLVTNKPTLVEWWKKTYYGAGTLRRRPGFKSLGGPVNKSTGPLRAPISTWSQEDIMLRKLFTFPTCDLSEIAVL